MDFRIEPIAIPVTDVDRARDVYVDKAGFTLDHDHTVSDEIRFVQLTPPGAAPGSAEGVQIVVGDAGASASRERQLPSAGTLCDEVPGSRR